MKITKEKVKKELGKAIEQLEKVEELRQAGKKTEVKELLKATVGELKELVEEMNKVIKPKEVAIKSSDFVKTAEIIAEEEDD